MADDSDDKKVLPFDSVRAPSLPSKPKEADAEVYSILENQPHMSGKATCLHCGGHWDAVNPVGTACFTCPECGLQTGVWCGAALPEEYWQCNCGCVYFALSVTGEEICAHCGADQARFDD